MIIRCLLVLACFLTNAFASHAASFKCIRLMLIASEKWPGYYTQLEKFVRNSSEINRPMRGVLDDFDREVKLTPELETYGKSLILEIKQLESFEGRTFRGVGLPNAVLERLLKKRKFVDKGFLSSSTELLVGETFAKTRYSNLETEVLFVIDSKKGKIIPNKMNHRRESEVVFLPATRFKVTAVEYSPFTEGYRYIRIYLADN